MCTRISVSQPGAGPISSLRDSVNPGVNSENLDEKKSSQKFSKSFPMTLMDFLAVLR